MSLDSSLTPRIEVVQMPEKRAWRVGTLVYTTAGLTVLCVWLLWGDFAYHLRTRSVVPVMKYLLRGLDASDLMIGFLLGFLPQTLALMIVPAVSHYSDCHRGRWGRRIPFLFVPTPFVALAMVGIGFGPQFGSALHDLTISWGWSRSTAMITVVSFFWILYELASTVCDTVFYGLFNDVVPKAVMGRFIAAFRMVTFIDGILFNLFVLDYAKTNATEIFVGVALFYAVCFTAMCLKVKEGEYPARPRPVARVSLLQSVKNYRRVCFSNSFYLWIYLFIALMSAATQPISLFVILFAEKLGLGPDHFGNYAAMQMTVSLCITFPLGWMVDRFHPIRMSMISMSLLAGVCLGAFFLVDGPHRLGVAVVIVGVASGMVQTSSTPLLNLLFPPEAFARLYGASTMIKLIGLAGIAVLSGWLLDATDHDYRFIYLLGCVLTVVMMLSLIAIWHRMREYGGIANYTPPPLASDD